MTTTALPPATRYAPAPQAALPLRRFTVDEYHRMIEDGYFAADERFELLEGLIVGKMSKNPPHESIVARARRVLDRRLPPGWHVRVQSTVTTSDSEPEPDLAIVAGDEMDYFRRHPGASDTALVVEVAHSTLRDDQTIKYRVYARAGFSPYWVLNVPGRRVHVYEQPSGDVTAPSYVREAEYGPGQAVPLVVGGVQIGPVPVDELLP
jgi:Uma2 family endonuclease